MLANQHFYHGSIRAYTVLMGSILSGLSIVREGGGKREVVPVPVTYASGHAYLKYTGERDTREKAIPRVSKILPAMVFSLTSFSYDPMRKLNSRERITHTVADEDGSSQRYVFGRVPYDFEYEVSIKTKNMDEMLQLVEQIVPYFDPDLVVKVEDAPRSNLGAHQDIKITLNNVQIDDIYEGDIEDHRLIECTMNFAVKGFLYKRVLEGAAVKTINFSYSPDGDINNISGLMAAEAKETFEQTAARELNNSIEEALFGTVNLNADPPKGDSA